MKGAANIIDEYLISIKPSVDMTSWNEAIGNIKTKLGGGLSNAGTALFGGDTKAFSEGLKTAELYLKTFAEVVNYAAEKTKEYADQAIEYSNKFISQSSMFVDTGTRDIMGKYGVGSTTAQSIGSVSDYMNISMSDYAKLTQAQRETFSELLNYYQAGLESIDTTKLREFNESVQEYQKSVIKFRMDTELRFMKILAESDAFPELLDTFETAMENITTIMDSDAFKTGAEVFMGILNGILEFVSLPLEGLGWLFGAGKSKDGGTTNNVTVNANSYGGISDSDFAIDIGLQVQNALTR